ncbi:MAG TPA: hypothetical protein DDZ21_10970 [Gammaproteobacteria bacterium]|nr:hypothetical protein [Gammaproteobacteria bacterium]
MLTVPSFFSGIGESLSGSFLQDGALWTLQNVPGFPPIIQTVHILGVAAVMGSIVLLNLRILGLAIPSQSITEITGRVMPWFWIALASNVISGAFFVFGRPLRYFNNPVFLWKLAALLPAVALTLMFHWLSKRQTDYWQLSPGRTWTARVMALLSVALIIAVCTAGRWIAYLEYLEYPLWSMEPYFDGSEYSFWVGVENWGLSQVIAATNWFPTLETIHVIAAAMVVGSILWVDLRLLGLAANRYPISTLNRELIHWTWGAFSIATVTGLGMFITRAAGHLDNPAFLSKLVLLALAGANMGFFHFRLYRKVDQWDSAAAIPIPVKTAGFLSLLLWSGVMLAGRWIGHIV